MDGLDMNEILTKFGGSSFLQFGRVHLFCFQNGFYSALPFLGMWAIMNISPIIADKIRSTGLLSTGITRKLFTSIGKAWICSNSVIHLKSCQFSPNSSLLGMDLADNNSTFQIVTTNRTLIIRFIWCSCIPSWSSFCNLRKSPNSSDFTVAGCNYQWQCVHRVLCESYGYSATVCRNLTGAFKWNSCCHWIHCTIYCSRSYHKRKYPFLIIACGILIENIETCS